MQPENLELLKYLRLNYPSSEISDYVKSFYQATFGPSHLNLNEAEALSFLEEEKDLLSNLREDPLVEAIGPRFSRVYLAKVISSNMSPTTFVRLFILSNKAPKGSRGDFLIALQDLGAAIQPCQLPFSKEDYEEFMDKYQKAGYPSLHHSEIYHKLYEPHYLLLAHNLAALLPYFIEIDTLTLNHEDVASYIKTLPYQIASQIFDLWRDVYPELKRPALV
jgi:hypothetical protein